MSTASPTDRADVLVVGGGPAGATAARTLAAAGVSTLVVDRARFPRRKPCGGALSARVVVRFPYLERAFERISTHWVSRLRLLGPSGRAVDLHSDSPAAVMIRRLEFDALLLDLAREAGAHVAMAAEVVAAEQHADSVSVTTRDGRRFSGQYLIACDGVHSVTARRLGLVGVWPRRSLAIDMMEETPTASLRATDPGMLWVQYGCPAPDGCSTCLWEGYGYVFPKRDHVNVGIGYLLAPYRDAAPGPAYGAQRAFVDRLTRDGVLRGESRRECFTPFLIPVAGPRRVPASGRVLLAGDAAGFVHGLTAEGIYYAMVSGDLAAKAVVGALASRRSRAADLSSYSRSWHAEVGTELRDAVLLQRYLFGRSDRVDDVIAGAGDDSPVFAAAIRYLTGRESYRRARALVLTRAPGLAFALAADAVERVWRALLT